MSTHVILLASAARPREAWRALLSDQPDIAVVGAVGDVADAAALLRSPSPTTILIDAPVSNADLARQLKHAAPDCGLLFLVASHELTDMIPLLQAGAAGCVSRDSAVGDLARAITPALATSAGASVAAGRGEIVFPPAIAAQVLRTLARGGGALRT